MCGHVAVQSKQNKKELFLSSIRRFERIHLDKSWHDFWNSIEVANEGIRGDIHVGNQMDVSKNRHKTSWFENVNIFVNGSTFL